MKVVYQETRVGVRYLYQNDEPKESVSYNIPAMSLIGLMPVQIFRRFQVTFGSPSDATVLIEAIRGYCICTPARGNESQKPPSMLPPPVVPSTTSSRVPSTAANHHVTPEESAVQSYEKTLENPLSHPSISPSIQQATPSATVGTNLGAIPTHARAAQPLQSYSNSALVTSVYPLESQTLLSSTGQTQASQFSVQMSNVALQRSSESSPIASVLHPPTWSDPPGASSTPPAVPSSNPVGPTIASVAALYQLPVEELESAVADILREPGFDEFVCNLSEPLRDTRMITQAQVGKLDKMWALHGFFKR